MLSDERLARLAAGGSETAFDVIHDRHAGALTACCRAIVRHEDDALDALQNTLLKAWCAIGRRGDAPVRAWMLRIARNESIAVLRRRRAVSELRDELPDHRQDLHESAARRAELARVLDGLDDLPARQRQALVLRTLGDVGYAEIARIQDTSQDAVRQSVSVARRSLRRGRLAGLAPVPAWLAELMAATGGGGATMPGSVGRVAVAVTATIAAAGSLGTAALPHARHRNEAATAAVPARTSHAAVAAPAAGTGRAVAAAPRGRKLRPFSTRRVRLAPAQNAGIRLLRTARGDAPPPSQRGRLPGADPRTGHPVPPAGDGSGPDEAVRVDAAGRVAAPHRAGRRDGDGGGGGGSGAAQDARPPTQAIGATDGVAPAPDAVDGGDGSGAGTGTGADTGTGTGAGMGSGAGAPTVSTGTVPAGPSRG